MTVQTLPKQQVGSVTQWLRNALLSLCVATPLALQAAPEGVTQVDLGKAKVSMINDGVYARPLDEKFVTNAPLEQVTQALRDVGLPDDRFDIPFNPLLVDIGKERVLIDTGHGEFGGPTMGLLLQRLQQAGVEPESVTTVLITHFHGDHINGLRNKAGELAFPNAKVMVPAGEWDWWMNDERMAQTPEAGRGTFNAARRVFGPLADSVVKVQPGDEVVPGIRALDAAGHTPGHTAYMIDGGKRKLLYWADTTNIAIFVRNPDWSVQFDMDAEKARETRRRIADLAIREKALVGGFHLPGSAVGELKAKGNGYEFTPLK